MFGKPNQNTAQNGTSKPSGMDMMIQSLLRSMGVGPDVLPTLIDQGKHLATQFVVAMQSTATDIAAIKTEQVRQRALLEDIARSMSAPGVNELYPLQSEVAEWKPQK